MAAKLLATLVFDAEELEKLLRAHVESQGYFVEDVKQGDDEHIVSARPMTAEELALHNLPAESLEDRLQTKIDSLVEGTARHFDRFKRDLEKQAQVAETSLADRLADLRDLNEQMQESFLEIQQLAEQQAALPDLSRMPDQSAHSFDFAPEPVRRHAPDPDPIMQPAVEFAAPVRVTPITPQSYETLSFADAAEALQQNAKAHNPNEATRQANYQKLHREMEREALEAHDPEDPREHIPGESTAFPSDLVTQ